MSRPLWCRLGSHDDWWAYDGGGVEGSIRIWRSPYWWKREVCRHCGSPSRGGEP